jgi:putative thiamine transport system substrate-binding protein
MLNRRHFLATSVASLFLPVSARAADWSATLAEAKDQTVYFNAWAGSDTINAYIKWAGDEVKTRFGVNVEHVKITDTAEVVKRVRDEVAAGKSDGSVDLVWINGENFRTMKNEKLLFGPFSESLPNYAFVDVAGKPTTRQDFCRTRRRPRKSPWGMAQLTFFADGAKVAQAAAQPGKSSLHLPKNFRAA